MYQLHGFMVINSLIDNTLGRVSGLGELSPQSLSYSREVAIYHDNEYANVRLYSFYSTLDGRKDPLTKNLAKVVLGIGNFLADESLSARITDNRADFIQKFTTEYAGRANLLETGKMVTNGRYWLPEYIMIKLTQDKRENQYKIWFADDSFQRQYDKYEIEVIPPIVTIDDFHKGVGVVKELLTDHTGIKDYRIERLHERVNQKAAERPYTYIKTSTYNYINPNDAKEEIPTAWTVIIYGEAGQNADIIRDEISKYVLKNSQHNQAAWERLIPDLFTPTEFYLSPFWTKFATENLQLRGGIHSPLVPYREVLPWCTRTMPGYSEEHIRNTAVVFNSIFKSIAIVACGGTKNRLVKSNFEEVWKDYCNIYTTSRDFNRISPGTQEFILFMNTMLLEAETLTPDSAMPNNFTRVYRNRLYFLVGTFNNVSYLMPLRWNFLAEITNSQKSSIKLPTQNPEGQQAGPDKDKRIQDVIDVTPSIGLSAGRTAGGTTTPRQNDTGVAP